MGKLLMVPSCTLVGVEGGRGAGLRAVIAFFGPVDNDFVWGDPKGGIVIDGFLRRARLQWAGSLDEVAAISLPFFSAVTNWLGRTTGTSAAGGGGKLRETATRTSWPGIRWTATAGDPWWRLCEAARLEGIRSGRSVVASFERTGRSWNVPPTNECN